jgi:hypothetical protein
MAVAALAVLLWAVALLTSWLSRRRARRQQAWLRSDVPADVAYARLQEELIRRQTGGVEPDQ